MYIDTVSLFNFYNGYWRVTELKQVDLNADKAKIRARLGESNSDSAVLHIRFVDKNGTPICNGKKYVKPIDYRGEVDTFTLSSGSNFSFFINGKWNGDSSINDEAYTDGFYNYINSVNDECYAITSVAKYSVIPHFEVMAK